MQFVKRGKCNEPACREDKGGRLHGEGEGEGEGEIVLMKIPFFEKGRFGVAVFCGGGGGGGGGVLRVLNYPVGGDDWLPISPLKLRFAGIKT